MERDNLYAYPIYTPSSISYQYKLNSYSKGSMFIEIEKEGKTKRKEIENQRKKVVPGKVKFTLFSPAGTNT